MSQKKQRYSVERSIKHCYSTWGEEYYSDYYGPDAPYPPVHLDLVKSLVSESDAKRVLDAGCGPASMTRHLVGAGSELYGFDLTPEMVSEARRVLGKEGVPESRVWEGSVLEKSDFVPPDEDKADFDCVICSGVLPHIPEASDIACIENLRDALRPGGIAIIEARNELFSLFTLNRYSHALFIERLIPVQELHAQSGDQGAGVSAALGEVEAMFRTDLPPIRKGKKDEPGYDEVLSRTHNPLILREQMTNLGFEDVRLLFYHFHCLPPMVEHHVPDLFKRLSIAMESNPSDWRGYFMASAFLAVGRRK